MGGFLTGLMGGDKKSTSTTTTNTRNDNVTQGDDGIVIRDGSTYVSMDADVAKASLASTEATARSSVAAMLENTQGALGRSYDFAESLNSSTTKLLSENLSFLEGANARAGAATSEAMESVLGMAKGSLGFAGDAQAMAYQFGGRALDFLDGESSANKQLMDRTLDTVVSANNNAASQIANAAAMVARNSNPDAENTALFAKLAAGLALGIIVVWAIRKNA